MSALTRVSPSRKRKVTTAPHEAIKEAVDASFGKKRKQNPVNGYELTEGDNQGKWQCNDCPKITNRKADMERHAAPCPTNPFAIMFHCPHEKTEDCKDIKGVGFNREDALKRHLNVVHFMPNETPEEKRAISAKIDEGRKTIGYKDSDLGKQQASQDSQSGTPALDSFTQSKWAQYYPKSLIQNLGISSSQITRTEYHSPQPAKSESYSPEALGTNPQELRLTASASPSFKASSSPESFVFETSIFDEHASPSFDNIFHYSQKDPTLGTSWLNSVTTEDDFSSLFAPTNTTHTDGMIPMTAFSNFEHGNGMDSTLMPLLAPTTGLATSSSYASSSMAQQTYSRPDVLNTIMTSSNPEQPQEPSYQLPQQFTLEHTLRNAPLHGDSRLNEEQVQKILNMIG